METNVNQDHVKPNNKTNCQIKEKIGWAKLRKQTKNALKIYLMIADCSHILSSSDSPEGVYFHAHTFAIYFFRLCHCFVVVLSSLNIDVFSNNLSN